jgi:membrane protease YdiL (CAAX protease family)
MYSDYEPDRNRILIIFEVFLVLFGLGIFAWFIHGGNLFFIIAVGGLLLASLIISFSVTRDRGIYLLLGSGRSVKKIFVYALSGFIVGVILAVIYRIRIGLSLIPVTLTLNAIISPLIGMTEELVFRGYVQGKLKTFGIFISIILAATAQAFYKFLVLKSLPLDVGIDFSWLFLITLLIGLIIGASRELSGSIVPAMALHAAFDIFFYGDFSEIPLWVWS